MPLKKPANTQKWPPRVLKKEAAVADVATQTAVAIAGIATAAVIAVIVAIAIAEWLKVESYTLQVASCGRPLETRVKVGARQQLMRPRRLDQGEPGGENGPGKTWSREAGVKGWSEGLE